MRNKAKLGLGILAIPLLLVVSIVWGLVEPYILAKEEEIAIISNLPTAWEGQKIGQVSDFQIGMWWDNVATVSNSIDKLIEEQPAAVLISGDFIYHATPNPEVEINEVINAIRPLTEANIPTYAVLGNHDYGMKSQKMPPKTELAAQLERALEDIGIQVLTNEAVKLPLPNNEESELYLVGIGAHWANNDKVDLALNQLPDDSPRVVMMHNPDSFAAFPANTAPFAIAGHTHGGQIRLPYLPQWSWLALVKKDKVFADAWVNDYGEAGNQLYVNRGIGFSDIPIRLNCAPEVTFFTLKSQ
ncbi:metallophosphoesterase [Oscillatoriales cyanobacterium LEGE 11467]|uniref:Metallophosphoesterase n=1 Tax=Zarconia navalis LEGE 11467 TaxID=1828826 RepID=A0A928W0U2_9CYAN|nr:metallophosphoesterase [Zarconia navalis]MBE9041803.1 metallophosphoesterase [Zarconia navalis LEGE 11467]